jgi:hypothetical protein
MRIDRPESTVTALLRANFSRLITERTTGFSGREWVFGAVDQWLGAAQTGRYLIGGRPGTGKTAIAARLVQMHTGEIPAPQQCPRLTRGFLAYHHFCQAGSESTLSPQDFVQALAEALAARYPDYRQSLESKSSPQYNVTVNAGSVTGGSVTGVRVSININGGEARGLFDELVRRPLRDLATARPAELIVILVDSLDEASTFNATNNIARLIASTKDLPPNVRFLLTARSGIDAVTRLVGEPALDLIANAPAGSDEVRTYAAGRLRAQLQEPSLGAVAQRLADQSHGNFLYAYHVLNLLESAPMTAAQIETFPFPNELEELYEEMMSRQLNADEEKWSGRFRPLLGAIAVAHGDGLTRDQLLGITGLAEDLADDLLRVAAEYLMGGRGQPYRLYHQSFREFLLRDGKFGVYPAERHAAVARWFENQYSADWESCRDVYALRYTARHWAEAAEASGANARPARTQSAVRLALDAGYQRACERTVSDLVGLREVVFLAMRVAALNDRLDMLPWVLRAAQGYLQFNRDYLQAEALVRLAEQGNLEEALSRLRLFGDIGENWQCAARLILCWLTLASAPKAVAAESVNFSSLRGRDPVINLLVQRVQAAIANQAMVPCPNVPIASVHLGRELVRRINGQAYDQEMLQAEVNGSFILAFKAGSELIGSGANQYASEFDGPMLVSIARSNGPEAAEGTALFEQYVQAHAGYNYVVYRNQSLWFLLEAALRVMPEQDWVRDRLRGILAAALTGGAVEYREMLPLTAHLLRANRDPQQGIKLLAAFIGQAEGQANQLQSTRGANDVWGDHKRRITALMELSKLVCREVVYAFQMRRRISSLPDGFAGFQSPAFLRFAEGLVACDATAETEHGSALHSAQVTAQHIQDYHFCARMNARCNTLRRWHATPLTPADLVGAIERLSRGTAELEFTSDHVVREPFLLRAPMAAQLRSVEPAIVADTLEKLAEVFQRRVEDFQAVNPMPPATVIAAGVLIHVPDPGLTPLLAMHLAARVLAEPALAPNQANLIRSLIVPASVNATALDTVLSYLLIAAAPADRGLLDRLVAEAGAVTFGSQPVPFAQIGPDAAMPA